MSPPSRTVRSWLFLLLLVLLHGGCRTLEYRAIQNDFERAVAEDNQQSQSPFVDWYRQVADSLTPDNIARLDEKLRPNAWMLRAVSQWRVGELHAARASAKNGLEVKPLPGSRAEVILTMIPALVIDAELREAFVRVSGKVAADTYTSHYGNHFATLIAELDKAQAKMNDRTPESVSYYWHFQRWRVLQNWSSVIAAIEPSAVETMLAANAQAQSVLGKELTTAITEAKKALPPAHPLTRLIQLEENAAR